MSKLIFGLILYIVVISMLVSVFAAGMGEQIEGGIWGVQVDENGAIISNSGGVVDYTPAQQEPSFWDGIPIVSDISTAIGGALESAGYIGGIISALAGLMLWTLPEAIFPLWANIIFIKAPIILLVVELVRLFLP